MPPAICILCSDCQCSSPDHVVQLDALYSIFYIIIYLVLYDCSSKCIKSNKSNTSSDFIVPGFNEHVKTLHNEVRNSYLIWKYSGRPRNDNSCHVINSTRLRFKYETMPNERIVNESRGTCEIIVVLRQCFLLLLETNSQDLHQKIFPCL